MARRSFSTDCKREAASLVLDQNYSLTEACTAMNVGPTAMQCWVEQLQLERSGRNSSASRILVARIRRIERENDILKRLPRS